MTAPLQVVYRPLTEIAPAKRNPRTHSAAQVEQIERSMQQFGWTNPILVDEHSVIIAGHGRYEAARKLAMPEVPTILLAGLSDAQKRALVIADNQLALNAGWDAEMLALELGELKLEGFDLGLVGFSDQELDQMLEAGVDPSGEWQGMPEFNHGTKAHRSLIIHFREPKDVKAFAKRIDQEIGDATKFLWFPAMERETLVDKAFVADAA